MTAAIVSGRKELERRQVRAWVSSALAFTTRRPWPAMGLGLAAGYLLGGGLFTPLTVRLARTAIALSSIPEVARSSTWSTPKSKGSPP